MTGAENITTGQPRIDAVDAWRGFALLGVGLVHVLEQSTSAPFTEQVAQVAAATTPDQIIQFVHHMLLSGKFYLMFSLLFGLSFFIQIDRRAQPGEPYGARFVWRLTILFVFGYIHHLFYRGDILMLYALLGLPLVIMIRLPTRVLAGIAIALFLGLGRYISFVLTGDFFAMDGAESPENYQYFHTLKNGSLWDVFLANNIDGARHLANFQFGIFGRGYVTFGLFLVGICLGRSGIFRNLDAHTSAIKKTLGWAVVATIASFALMMVCWSQVEDPEAMNFSTWLEAIALTFYDLFNLAFSAILSCGFLLGVLKAKRLLQAFAPYGRMALTNYLLQSLIGSFIFYGWGLGLLGEWPYRYLLLLAASLAIAQLVISKIWLKYHYYGPCEWLWRALTLRQVIALRRPRDHRPSVEYMT